MLLESGKVWICIKRSINFKSRFFNHADYLTIRSGKGELFVHSEIF